MERGSGNKLDELIIHEGTRSCTKEEIKIKMLTTGNNTDDYKKIETSKFDLSNLTFLCFPSCLFRVPSWIKIKEKLCQE